MKLTAFLFAASAAVALAANAPTRQPPASQPPRVNPLDDGKLPKDAEPLPEFPKLDPKNAVVPLNPDKTVFAEVNAAKKVVRVGVAAEVSLREGPLEVFLCKRGTKEHESILRVNADAQIIHAALNTAGAKEGKPTQFVNPKTEMPEYKAATGTKIKVTVHYRKGGKLHTHPAQDWVWNATAKKKLEHDWVFAGSMLIPNQDDPAAKPFYGANSGEVISISNFLYSMLEIPADISKDDAVLNYAPKTEMIPPLFSKVWVILEPDVKK